MGRGLPWPVMVWRGWMMAMAIRLMMAAMLLVLRMVLVVLLVMTLLEVRVKVRIGPGWVLLMVSVVVGWGVMSARVIFPVVHISSARNIRQSIGERV